MEFVWFCCKCLYEGYGGMSPKLTPKCLICGHKCKNCPTEFAWGEKEDERDSLYSRSEENVTFAKGEALRHFENGALRHFEDGALRKTDQPSISRASTLPAVDTSVYQTNPLQYLDPTKETETTIPDLASLIHSYHNETEPIGGVEQEIGRLGQIYEDGECTPRSCSGDDISDTFDLDTTVDKDKDESLASVLFGEDYPDLPLDFDFPSILQQYQNNADTFLNDGTYSFNTDNAESLSANSGIDLTYPNQPDQPGQPDLDRQLDLWDGDMPNFLVGDNTTNIAHISAAIEPSTLLSNPLIDAAPGSYSHLPFHSPVIPHSNMHHQLPTTEPPLNQIKTSLSPAPFPPSPSGQESQDRQHINKKRKTSQIIRACESCLSTTELNGKSLVPLACPYYKHDPLKYLKCSSMGFKNISSMKQHLDTKHKLKDHHCKICWISFNDERSLKAHAGCQPTSGIPVDELNQIPKHQKGDNWKWYWTCRQLFGQNTPTPDCPYRHPRRDMKDYCADQFLQHLRTKGTHFDVCEMEEIRPQWVASDLGLSSDWQSTDMKPIPTPI
ncbi:hypothetical protein F4781DRAFT_380742 [Annulohypoxylon bovei var. microspora]|nr:hypothetical protein F4781DRAFT_380742 [Annulohypoxylon bovei var. microspora]